MKRLLSIPVFCALLGLSACVKQPSYSVIPHLDFKSFSKDVLNLNPGAGYGSDSILVTLSFTDGDGDFGPPDGTAATSQDDPSNHANDSAVIADPAYSVYYYSYQQGDSFLDHKATRFIANDGKYKAITGDINVYPVLECPPTGNTDTIYYSFFIKDRAGHLSNRVRSTKVVVNCN